MIKSFIYYLSALIINKLHLYARKSNIQKLRKKGILFVDKYSYGIDGLQIDTYKGSVSKVYIGKFCSISKNVRIICGGIHPTEWISTFPLRVTFNLSGKYKDGMPMSKGDIRIGNDVWIGTDVTILSGVTIGNGVVICSNTVVTKNIPSYSIAAGVPAKVVRYRFSEKEILCLESIEWWDWDEKKIIENINYLSSNNIKEFLNQVINS